MHNKCNFGIIIGNVKLENSIFLAPMAGITDKPYRILCKEQGCGLVYTEMVSAKGMHYDNEKSHKLSEISTAEKPAAVQIFGSEPSVMVEIVERLNYTNADIIDINMGCPTPKITKNGEGCALMLNPPLVRKIVSGVVKVSKKPITIKIRKGWDKSKINAVEIAKIAEDNGAAAVAVHGRTRDQFYSGKADWDTIADVKKALSIPVIGNGDIFSPEDAKKMFIVTNCDGIMVGRGAQGDPWIFRRILHYLNTNELLPLPSKEEKLNMIIRHMDMLITDKGAKNGVKEMRKHIAWYIKGMRNSTYVKQQVFRLITREEVIEVIRNLCDDPH